MRIEIAITRVFGIVVLLVFSLCFTCEAGPMAAGPPQEILAYDSAGNVVKTIDPLGFVESMTYDPVGNRLDVIESNTLGQSQTWQYDPAGNVLSMTDPLAGIVSASTYDSIGNRIYEADSTNNMVYAYDPAGNVVQTIDPLGIVESMTYDPVGNRLDITERDALGNSELWQYDTNGNVLSMTDPLAGMVSASAYDSIGNRIYQADSTSKMIYAYDTNSNVVQTIDPLGIVTSMTYDTLGNTLSVTEIDPLGQSQLWQYDPVGNVISMTDVPGTATSSAYDLPDNFVWIAVTVPMPAALPAGVFLLGGLLWWRYRKVSFITSSALKIKDIVR